MGKRADKVIADEVARGDHRWWWLSFASEHRFLGGGLVQAFGPVDAVRQSHLQGWNPGGEVLAIPSPDNLPEPDKAYTNRLLTRAEAEEIDQMMLKKAEGPHG